MIGNKFAKGQVRSEETRRKIGLSAKGDKSYAWKGDNVGYRGIHKWIQNQKTRPKKCSMCGEIKKLDWANIDHKYHRNLKDYLALCRKCHKRFDKIFNKKEGEL